MYTLIKNYKKLLVGAISFLALGLMFLTTPAFAGLGVGVAPDFPATVTVGQTAVPVGLEITNNSTSDVGTITLSNIRLITSCGDTDANSTTCVGAEVDPGVFTVSSSGTGSGACTGTSFTIATDDATTGRVLFTPSSPVSLVQGATCRINFTVNVNQAPVDDSSPNAGMQTLQIGTVSASNDGLSGVGLGTDEVTVNSLGHIIVNKITLPAGDPQSFNFDAVGGAYADFSLTDAATPNDQTLTAGAYSISETLPTGWVQTSATCISSLGDNENIGALELDAGETITCTFTNTKNGRIIVDKITNPSGSSQSFNFDATGGTYTDFSLTDAATVNNQEVAPGAYSISETLPTGWVQTSATCNMDETPASLDVGPGETVTCTFTNTQLGTITIVKDTVPNDGTDFTFTSQTLPGAPFMLDDDSDGTLSNTKSHTNLAAGTYSVAETANLNYATTSSCSDGSPVTAIVLGEGESITCTFVNTLQQGHIIVDKITSPSGSTQSFNFTTTGGGYNNFSLTDGAAPNDQALNAGTYSVAEGAVSGWTQTSATCSDGSPVTAIVLGAGETVTCTFTNTLQPGHLIVQKTTIPGGNTTSFNITASGTGTITGGGSGTITDAIDKDYTVTAGTYSVTETIPAGWNQTSNTCTNVVVAPGQTVTCVITNTQVVEYCSPGYWKQSQHFINWVGYDPDDKFSAVFGENITIMWSSKGKPAPVTDPTLLQALEANGGGINMLARATVGALLNAAALESGYTTAQVIDMFQDTYPGTNAQYQTLVDAFTAEHNCPLGSTLYVPQPPTTLPGALAPEDFGVVNYEVSEELGTLKGYTAGFAVSDNTLAGATSVVVKLYGAGDTLLQTNTAILSKFNLDITGTQFSSPFDVSGDFDYALDGYWTNAREAEYGQSIPATKVVATVTLANGKIVTATNTTLSGDPITIYPPVVVLNATTNAATGISSTDATLNGMNGGSAATGHSFWASLNTFSTASPTIPAGVYSTPDLGAISANTNFSASLSSTGITVTPGTQYYYSAWTLVGGTWYPGTVMSFTTNP